MPNKLIAIHLDYAGFVRNKQVSYKKDACDRQYGLNHIGVFVWGANGTSILTNYIFTQGAIVIATGYFIINDLLFDTTGKSKQ